MSFIVSMVVSIKVNKVVMVIAVGMAVMFLLVQETDMEAEFLSLGMDIIGLGVFNYDFRSLTTESPVIKVLHLSA